jgi:hypothetical protein
MSEFRRNAVGELYESRVAVSQILNELVDEYSNESYEDGYDDGWRRGSRYQKKDRDAE